MSTQTNEPNQPNHANPTGPTAYDRRRFLGLVPAAGLAAVAGATAGPALAQPYGGPPTEANPATKPAGTLTEFPRQGVAAAREFVRLCHFDLDTVTKLVTARPALAKSAYDLGYGDWEAAIGAASHVGRRDIVELLVAHGARPDMFTFAMLGDIDTVRAMVADRPELRRVHGPHGITLLRHAILGGDEAASVVDYLQSLGDAGTPEPEIELPADRITRYTGEYPINASDKLVVAQSRGDIQIGLNGEEMRLLKYQGGDAFAPAGSPAVRIVFGGDGDGDRAAQVTIHDPEPIVTGRR
ncbi:MAG: hypothetical protein AAFR38_05655 [Planctomycetota bacterium]